MDFGQHFAEKFVWKKFVELYLELIRFRHFAEFFQNKEVSLTFGIMKFGMIDQISNFKSLFLSLKICFSVIEY